MVFLTVSAANLLPQMQLRVTDLLADLDQLTNQLAEASILGDLLVGVFDGRALGNDAGDGLAGDRVGGRVPLLSGRSLFGDRQALLNEMVSSDSGIFRFEL